MEISKYAKVEKQITNLSKQLRLLRVKKKKLGDKIIKTMETSNKKEIVQDGKELQLIKKKSKKSINKTHMIELLKTIYPNEKKVDELMKQLENMREKQSKTILKIDDIS